MARRWPIFALIGAAVLALAWLPNTYFFMLEAWGARGEPKSAAFEAWAVLTWIGLPVAVVSLGIAGIAGAVTSKRHR